MTRYPRQVNREYLSCRSGGLNKIQMIDGGTLDLHQDLVACDRRRRYIVEHQLPTVFQQSDGSHESLLESAQWVPTTETAAPDRTPMWSYLDLGSFCRAARFSAMNWGGRDDTWPLGA